MKAQEERDRQHRAKVRELEKQLQDMQEDLNRSTAAKEELERRVKRGTERLDSLRAYGDGWKKKYTDLKETIELKMEEQIRDLESTIKDRGKKMKEVERKNTLLENRSATLEDTLQAGEKKLEANVELRCQVYLPCRCIGTFVTVSFIPIH